MSRKLVALPRTEIQKKEQYTLDLVIALREMGFAESEYEKPYRVFKRHTAEVRLNMRDGVILYKKGILKGADFFTAIDKIQQLYNASVHG